MKRIPNGIFRLAARWWIGAGVPVLFSLTVLHAQTNDLKPAPAGPPPAPRRASIILILADDIGYGDLGCYGQTKIKTPNLDRLAAEGSRFTSFYAGSPEDPPARAALMTGMEPRHSRAGFNQALAPDAVTIAGLLQESGYRTCLVGEWNLGDTDPMRPDQKGFYEFLGFLGQAHAREYYTDRMWRIDPNPGSKMDGPLLFTQNQAGQRGLFMPDMLGTASVRFVNNNKPDAFNKYRPFFLCLAYPIPHKGPVPTDAPYNAEPWSQLEKDRAAMITRMDESIGKLLAELKRLGLDTNTAIFFASVNGPQAEGGLDLKLLNSTGSLRGSQGSVYDGGLRVPMIVRWPAKIKSGQVADIPSAGWDLFPTALEIARLHPPEKIDGISLLPTLRGQTQTNRHDILYWETRVNGLQQAARIGDWKGVRTNATAALELYHLKTDPGEKVNVAQKNAAMARKIEKVLSDTAARP